MGGRRRWEYSCPQFPVVTRETGWKTEGSYINTRPKRCAYSHRPQHPIGEPFGQGDHRIEPRTNNSSS